MRTFATLVLLLSAAALGAADQPLRALAQADGSLRLMAGERDLGAFMPGLADPTWRFAGAVPAAGGFAIGAPDGGRVTGKATIDADHGGVAADWSFTPTAELKLNSLHLSGEFPVTTLAGGSWKLDGQSGPFPAQLGQPALVDADARRLEVVAADGSAFSLSFAEPTRVMIQDNRRWGGQTFSLRIGHGGVFKAGEATRIAFALAAPGGVALEVDHPVTIAAGVDWIPLRQDSLDIEAGSALDFSTLVERVAPAGRLGRVIAVDGRFAFADDAKTPRRFYGANLCFTAQYLAHEDADRLVERLARIGYNALRIHHYEGELVGHKPGAPSFVAEKIDQLDYLVAACAKRGIYVTTDLYVSRPVSPEQLGLAAGTAVNYKILVPVLPAAFADWKGFATMLLDHVNPYGGRRWADDPTLAWLAMINEGNFENYWKDIRVSDDWRRAWNAWLAAAYPDRAALVKDWGDVLGVAEDQARGSVALPTDLNRPDPRARDAARFMNEVERDMFARMRKVVAQDLGCRALLSDASSWTNRQASQLARATYDYDDDHFYVDHPEFVERPWTLPSRIADRDPLVDGATGGLSCCFTGLAGAPLTITEFNYAAPSRHRAMGGALTGALAALQDFGAVWRFAYSHARETVLGPRPVAYFDVGSDPLNLAAERAGLCLFLRGDAASAKHRVALSLRADELRGDGPSPMPRLAPRWTWLAWVTGARTALIDDQHPLAAGFADLPASSDAYELDDAGLLAWLRGHGVAAEGVEPAKRRLLSDTGEIRLLGDEERLVIDTPRSAGGAARPGGAIDATHAGLRVDRLTQPATVFASALDDQPLKTSKRILVSHLTELLDEGTTFAEQARRTLTGWGKLPHLARAGSARVALALAEPKAYQVWALSTTGARVAPVAAQVVDGALVFTANVAGAEGARLCYEVARE